MIKKTHMNDRREETTLENKPLDNKSEINNKC